ncbi:DrmE family protein [Thermoflavimicrobium daqui]|uniref:DISARM protein DrmE C-terminal domain-containing protein n=1 Tax=Thermoflavimicrobium daqui TaxID=2137476 RepID=A0A364K790_9BACL|nr:DrmE family protein [Thermoflavimicrobium daqui]RAL26171.1 hypothetical protein DL897_04015 [Thermoflavimicrobium daqui]
MEIDYIDEFLSGFHVSARSSKKETEVHPIIKNIVFKIKQEIDSKNIHIVIKLPKKSNIALWITTIYHLLWLKENYKRIELEKSDLKIGQRLLLNGCLVEYLGKSIDGKKIKVRCKDLDYQFSFKHVYSLILVENDRRSLAKHTKLQQTFKNTISKVAKLYSLNAQAVLQSVLNCNVLIANYKEVNEFGKKLNINGTRISDFFPWYSLSSQERNNSYAYTVLSLSGTCIVSNNFLSLIDHMEENNSSVNVVFVDGVEIFEKEFYDIREEFINNKIPIVFFSDEKNDEIVDQLKDEGFTIIDMMNKVQDSDLLFCSYSNPFYEIDNYLYNYLNLELIDHPISEPMIIKLPNMLEEIRKDIGLKETRVKDLYYKLFIKMVYLTKIIRIPDATFVKNQIAEIEKYKDEVDKLKMWIGKREQELILRVISKLKKLVKVICNSVKNGKVKAINTLVKKNPSKNYLLIVGSEKEKVETQNYWIKKTCNLYVSTLSELNRLKIDQRKFAKIIISGWFGKEKVKKIKRTYFGSNYTVLLYSFELDWFNKYIGKEKVLTQQKYDLELPNAEDRIDQVKKEISDLQIKRYCENKSNRDLVKAKMVRFHNNKCAFFHEGHKLYQVNNLVYRKESQLLNDIPKKTVKEIRLGDYVIFRERDSDIIRELVDQKLKKEGRSYLRDYAALWRKALWEIYKLAHEDLSMTVRLLEKNGCTRHTVTVKNWLFNDLMIGPRNFDDVEIIAKTSNYQPLIKHMDQVANAVDELTKIHRSVAHELQHEMLRKLTDKVPKDNLQSYDDSFMLDGLGRIYLLRVEYISEEWVKVDAKNINKLINMEGNLWLE